VLLQLRDDADEVRMMSLSAELAQMLVDQMSAAVAIVRNE
jgi:hypothetical protein